MSDNSWLRKLRADFMADPNLFRLINDKASAPPSCSLSPKKARDVARELLSEPPHFRASDYLLLVLLRP